MKQLVSQTSGFKRPSPCPIIQEQSRGLARTGLRARAVKPNRRRPAPCVLAPPPACWPRPGLAQLPGSGGTVLSRHCSDFFPSAVHCFLFCNGIWAGEAAAAAGASLPPGTGRPHFRSAGSGSEEGIPRRLPLPEGVRAVAPAPVPAAAGAPVGAASGRGRGGLTPGLPPS